MQENKENRDRKNEKGQGRWAGTSFRQLLKNNTNVCNICSGHLKSKVQKKKKRVRYKKASRFIIKTIIHSIGTFQDSDVT